MNSKEKMEIGRRKTERMHALSEKDVDNPHLRGLMIGWLIVLMIWMKISCRDWNSKIHLTAYWDLFPYLVGPKFNFRETTLICQHAQPSKAIIYMLYCSLKEEDE